MQTRIIQTILFNIFIFKFLFVFSQPFQTIGGAYNIPSIENSNCAGAEACFTLTNNVLWQQGAVWDLDTIDLTQAFDATFCMFIGANDNGADGFAFVMRSPNSNNYGENGGGLGYGSATGVDAISPSLAIEFDSFYNPDFFDIPEDHTALVINGIMNVPPAVPSIPLLPNGENVEDNNFHNARIVWNPNTQEISMYFDGFLRFTYTNDFINNVFEGNPNVLWGFTASTCGLSNLQQICFPKIIIDIPDQVVCYNDSIQISYYHENLTEYYWLNPSNETLLYWNSSMGNPLIDTSFYTNEPGQYELFVEFNNKIYSSTFNVTFDNSPPLNLGGDISFCVGESIVLNDLNTTTWSSSLWNTGTTVNSLSVSSPGTYWLQVSNVAQCVYRDSIILSNYPLPTLDLLPFEDSLCTPDVFNISAVTEPGTNLTWVFEDGTTITNQNQIFYSNDTPGVYDFVINAISMNACTATFSFPNSIFVLEQPIANFDYLVNETELGYSVNLSNQSSSYNTLIWTYGNNLSSNEDNPYFIANETLNSVRLVAYNSICTDTITKIISLDFKEVIIPNIITSPRSDSPNGILNLFNDDFKNFSIKIFNRWGNLVYEGTKKPEKPLFLWDGVNQQNSKVCSDGIYFILLDGELKNNDNFNYQGFVTVIGG
jgi:hypothetical protein